MKVFITPLLAALGASAALAQAALPMTEAEVRKVDLDAKKITLKHGEIKNLGMPPMSMVFQLKDRVQLDKFKVGDKVQFSADNVNGAMTVIAIEPLKQ